MKMKKSLRAFAVLGALVAAFVGAAPAAYAEGNVAETGGIQYATLQEAIDKAANGTAVTLIDNVTIGNKPVVVSDKELTLNLNGKTIDNSEKIWQNIDDWSLISVRNQAHLTIEGPGNLQAMENDCYAADVQRGGKLTVNGGFYNGNAHCIYVHDGSLVINGGKFAIQQLSTGGDYHLLINCLDNNYTNGTAVVEVNGGEFCGFNPGNNTAEPNPPISFLGYGSAVTEDTTTDPITYTVSQLPRVAEINGRQYVSLNDAIANVKAGETITMLADVPNATGIAVPSGSDFTIDFAGHTYTAAGPGAGSANTETNVFQFLKDSNITLKNGVIDAVENASANNIKRFIQNYANLTLENMTFNTKNLGEDENYALSFNNGNVVFKGETSINTSSPDIVAFDVCKFSPTVYPSCNVTFDKTFTGTVGGQIVFDSDDGSSHKLVIDGAGTFAGIKPSGDLAAQAAKTGIQITKGTFQAPIDDEWLAPDAVLQKNPDGSYGVHIHVAKHVESKPATCTEDGNIEHWACSECGKLFEDEGLTKEIAAKDVVVKATGHDVENAVHHEGKAATVEAEGVVEHWECPVCHALFLDEGLTKPVTADDVVLPKLDPEPGPKPDPEPTPDPEPGEDEKPGPKPEVKPGEDTAAKGDTLPTTGDASMVAVAVSGLAGMTALAAATRRRKAE